MKSKNQLSFFLFIQMVRCCEKKVANFYKNWLPNTTSIIFYVTVLYTLSLINMLPVCRGSEEVVLEIVTLVPKS